MAALKVKVRRTKANSKRWEVVVRTRNGRTLFITDNTYGNRADANHAAHLLQTSRLDVSFAPPRGAA